MMKEQHKTEALKGQFPPFLISKSEIVLTSVTLRDVMPEDRVELKLTVGWDKPVHWDMGDLEIMIRKGAADGPIIFQAAEACFYRAHTKLEYTESGVSGLQIYYLTVSSAEERARVVGPYSLEGTVYEP